MKEKILIKYKQTILMIMALLSIFILCKSFAYMLDVYGQNKIYNYFSINDLNIPVLIIVMFLFAGPLQQIFLAFSRILKISLIKTRTDYFRTTLNYSCLNRNDKFSSANFIQQTNTVENQTNDLYLVLVNIIFILSLMSTALTLHYYLLICLVFFTTLRVLLGKYVLKDFKELENSKVELEQRHVIESKNLIHGSNLFKTNNKIDNYLSKIYNEIFNYTNKVSKIAIRKDILLGIDNFISILCVVTMIAISFIFVKSNIIDATSAAIVISFTNGFYNSVLELFESITKYKSIDKAVFKKYDQTINLESIDSINNFDLNILNLNFKYNDDLNIFNSLNLEFKHLNKYLIKAPSGKGKTTLFNLITKKLDNYQGDIKLGDNLIKDLNQTTINNYIGYITQDTYIFTASIKDNITLFNEVDEKILDEICRMCDIYSINTDINYMIENNGENISGGQKQKIALARELINNHQIILMDETLNSLDINTINELLSIILKVNATIIMIAHNLNNEHEGMFDKVIYI